MILQGFARNNGNMYIKDALNPDNKDAWIEIFDFWQKYQNIIFLALNQWIIRIVKSLFRRVSMLRSLYWKLDVWHIIDIAPDTTIPEKLNISGTNCPSHQVMH